MLFPSGGHFSYDRRSFVVAGGLSFFGANLAAAATSQPGSSNPRRKVAKSAIMIWLSGGASHIDTWDMKPDAPAEYRGPFRPMRTSASGIMLCEHLPYLARQALRLGASMQLRRMSKGALD